MVGDELHSHTHQSAVEFVPVPSLLPVPAAAGTSNGLQDYFTTTVVSNNLKHEFHPGMHSGIVRALAKQRWTKKTSGLSDACIDK